jgi:hypothetical protein
VRETKKKKTEAETRAKGRRGQENSEQERKSARKQRAREEEYPSRARHCLLLQCPDTQSPFQLYGLRGVQE